MVLLSGGSSIGLSPWGEENRQSLPKNVPVYQGDGSCAMGVRELTGRRISAERYIIKRNCKNKLAF